MGNESGQAFCTNVEWIGRAHCDKCHIRKLMLFSELPDTAFHQLLQPIDHFLYPTGSVLYEAGSDKEFIYSIRRGIVKLKHIAQDGSSRIVRLLGNGAAIGLELLDGAPSYHHTAIALTPVDLCKIPLSTIRQLENDHPKLCVQVSQQLQNQLNIADQWIVALSTGAARQRVAQLVLLLERFFSEDNGAFILINREDMAAMTGIAVETVSRMIADFKRQKILYRYKDNYYMCNVAALLKISSND
jgi:CRP/FNR family transcriptional regulator, anaerobic regulatory protein